MVTPPNCLVLTKMALKALLTLPANDKEFFSNDKGVLISRSTLCFGKS